jgi:hypothetical protein
MKSYKTTERDAGKLHPSPRCHLCSHFSATGPRPGQITPQGSEQPPNLTPGRTPSLFSLCHTPSSAASLWVSVSTSTLIPRWLASFASAFGPPHPTACPSPRSGPALRLDVSPPTSFQAKIKVPLPAITRCNLSLRFMHLGARSRRRHNHFK